MSEYIEREAVIQAFCDGCIVEKDCHASPKGYVCAEVKTINAIPAADVRPVVTCKECANWETDWSPTGTDEKRHYCIVIDNYSGPDWYCADGELKDGAEMKEAGCEK